MSQRPWMAVLALASTLLVAGRAHAATASAAINLTGTGGTPATPTYNYSIALHNTGSTNIGAFWFSWIPGQDYMATSPTNIVNPSGWSSTITGGGANNGYAILFTTTTTPLAAGNTLGTFAFTSLDTPASFAANSIYYPSTPVGTSFVYNGAPFQDPGFQFVVAAPTVTPEPTVAVAAIGVMAGAVRRRRRR